MSDIQAIDNVPTEEAARQAHFDKLAYELGDLQRWREFNDRKHVVGVPSVLKVGDKLLHVREISEGTVLMPDGSARNTLKVKMRKKDRMRQRHANARKAFEQFFQAHTQ